MNSFHRNEAVVMAPTNMEITLIKEAFPMVAIPEIPCPDVHPPPNRAPNNINAPPQKIAHDGMLFGTI